jgi:hypothetical protein
MARSRLPQGKAEISGAIAKNAGRFADRKAPKGRPVGEPYLKMTDGQKAAWAELVGDMPWLRAHHRTLLQMTCQVKARLDEGEEVGVSALSLLSTLLSKLGATPVDDTKVNHGDDGEVDPADRFFEGRPN